MRGLPELTGSILRIEDVKKSFGGLMAVAGASLSVARGSITALIGPNGAGKTTLFDIITGYERLDTGTVCLDGQRIDGLASHKIARLGLVRTFQMTRVFAAMTVRDNMLLAAPRQPGESLQRFLFQRARSRRAETAAEAHAQSLMHRFNLDGLADNFAGTLSGGQRKLLEFARALMAEPRLLLLDEPMAGVNRTLGTRIMDEVEELRRGAGMTFLFIEHDIDVVMRRADNVIVMANGQVIAKGSPAIVQRDSSVVDAYLGRRKHDA
jgi:neutral amino acid transport system ATP-binding protein